MCVFNEDIYKIDGKEYYERLTNEFNNILSRIFDSEYRQLIHSLRKCRKDGKNPSYIEAVDLMKQLADYQQRIIKFAETEASVKDVFSAIYMGIKTDWCYVSEQMEILRAFFTNEISFGFLTDYPDFISERTKFADYAEKLNSCLYGCDSEVLGHIAECFDSSILDIKNDSISLVLERCNACIKGMGNLDNWLHFCGLLSKLNDHQAVDFIHTAIHHNIEARFFPSAFKKQFYLQWIESILSSVPILVSFNRISQDNAIRTFVEKDVEQFEINKAKIRAKLSSNRPSIGVVASGSALAVLLREGEKKRKQKSIRTLLAETGELVQRIKPCFLMSPLSVSTFLAPDSIRFDVVVFDEASQIFPQDAIGAIYRAKQMIVVGDSKQMPPSNFFSAMLEGEDNDEESGDVTDFESILDLCSASMQQLRLRWHYRSRYEQLILFSNKNFYDNELITFPSSQIDAPGIGVDYYHVDGVFDQKSHTNRKEAEFVVDLIYENIRNYPNRSLGVVAFSIKQQELIDKLLIERRQNMPELEWFFKNDGIEPFFIKNLETVQGDERDTIIFSVAYGVNTQGRLLHNFGPLNRAGGERRLNVAFTRAKYNIQLVSSMRCADIDLNRTSAEGAKLLREYLDFAENGNIALERTISVNSFEQFDSDFELEVCEFLRSKGFSVDTQIGCSGFRIDLGLKMPNSSNYVLAIECDGATYHSSKNARDRDRLRQEILERMGWKFYRIWSTDWFRNKTVEQSRLLEAATDALKNPIKGNEPQRIPNQQNIFEVVTTQNNFRFPHYKAANIDELQSRYPYDFKSLVKEILIIEAPLSEEFLLKRIVGLFGREKVTRVVQQTYNYHMYECQRFGIVRRNGFLYLSDMKEISFRIPGDVTREVKHIAPEELAAGMLEIIKQNVTVDKKGLYRSLALQCGVNRVGKAISEHFDVALHLLDNMITVEDEQICLK